MLSSLLAKLDGDVAITAPRDEMGVGLVLEIYFFLMIEIKK